MKLGDWFIYCDICGRKCLASKAVQLPHISGRGGMIVCPYDADCADPGIIPIHHPVQKNIPWTRINHQDTTDSSPNLDLEDMTLQYYLLCSQDGAQLLASQDSAWLTAGEHI